MAQVTQGYDSLLVGRWLLRLRARASPTPSSPYQSFRPVPHLTLTSECFHTLATQLEPGGVRRTYTHARAHRGPPWVSLTGTQLGDVYFQSDQRERQQSLAGSDRVAGLIAPAG